MTRDEFVQKLKDQLDELNGEVDKLEARYDAAESDVRERYREQLADAKTQRARAEKKLQEVRAAGEDAWEDLKGDAEYTWKAFRDSVSYFKSRFR